MTHTKDFISQLASKLGRPTPTDLPPAAKFQVPQYHLSDRGERTTIFLSNWHALGGKGAIVKTAEETVTILTEWFGDLPFNWIKNPDLLLAWDKLPPFAESAFSTLNWPLARYSLVAPEPHGRYSVAAQAELGITGADWGIALSGTIVTKTSSDRGRAVSLLPPRHLSFIEASKLRDNLYEVLEEISALGTPSSAIEMISGPSRTSDIEMDLSIGVHGPIEVYVIVIDD